MEMEKIKGQQKFYINWTSGEKRENRAKALFERELLRIFQIDENHQFRDWRRPTQVEYKKEYTLNRINWKLKTNFNAARKEKSISSKGAGESTIADFSKKKKKKKRKQKETLRPHAMLKGRTTNQELYTQYSTLQDWSWILISKWKPKRIHLSDHFKKKYWRICFIYKKDDSDRSIEMKESEEQKC